MENDLLISLRKYRPRETRNPSENFITEAFAWLLKTNLKFSEHYIKHICDKLNFKMDASIAKWNTQVNFSGKFPDLVCEANGKALVFEHKLFTHLHKDQLQNYREYAKQEYEDYRLILLTANTNQHEQNPDLPICWEDIYKLIEEWIIKNDDNTNLLIFKNFLRLLEFEGIGPKAPISHESIMYYFRAKYFEANVHNLMLIVSQTGYTDFAEFIPKEEYQLTLRNEHQRIGVSFHNTWQPCLFAGVICGGHIHEPILGLDSPDVAVMLCFEKPLHDKYTTDVDYKSFVKELKQKANDLQDGWEIYLHLESENEETKNMWHPIYIRKPLIKMMAGTKNTEDQKKVFIDSIKEILPYFTDSIYFQNMRKKWSPVKSNI